MCDFTCGVRIATRTVTNPLTQSIERPNDWAPHLPAVCRTFCARSRTTSSSCCWSARRRNRSPSTRSSRTRKISIRLVTRCAIVSCNVVCTRCTFALVCVCGASVALRVACCVVYALYLISLHVCVCVCAQTTAACCVVCCRVSAAARAAAASSSPTSPSPTTAALAVTAVALPEQGRRGRASLGEARPAPPAHAHVRPAARVPRLARLARAALHPARCAAEMIEHENKHEKRKNAITISFLAVLCLCKNIQIYI